MLFADVVPSTADPFKAAAGLAMLGAVLITIMVLALREFLRVRRERREVFARIRARGRTIFVDERPLGALPPCVACGADACDHVRELPAREGTGGVCVEMQLGPDGVARGELIVER